jgi:hypothetical protein
MNGAEMSSEKISHTGPAAVMMVIALLTIGPRTFSRGQVRVERISKIEAFPYVFYTVVTDCSEKRADITYQAGRGESSQATGDLPWYDFRDFRPETFYYLSAQKASDEGCELRVTIFLVYLSPDQLRKLPRDPKEVITFIIMAGAHMIRTSTTDGPYGIAEVDWNGEKEQDDETGALYPTGIRSEAGASTEGASAGQIIRKLTRERYQIPATRQRTTQLRHTGTETVLGPTCAGRSVACLSLECESDEVRLPRYGAEFGCRDGLVTREHEMRKSIIFIGASALIWTMWMRASLVRGQVRDYWELVDTKTGEILGDYEAMQAMSNDLSQVPTYDRLILNGLGCSSQSSAGTRAKDMPNQKRSAAHSASCKIQKLYIDPAADGSPSGRALAAQIMKSLQKGQHRQTGKRS